MDKGISESVFGYVLIAIAMTIGLKGALTGSFFRPRTLFLFVHPLAMGFALLNLFWTENGFHQWYFFVTIASWAAFLVGCLIAESKFSVPIFDAVSKKSIHEGWSDYLIPAVGAMCLYALSKAAGGWPIFSENPESMRAHMISGRLTAMLFSFGIFSVVYSVEQALMHRRRLFFVGALIVVVLVGLTGNRGQIFMASIVGLSLLETTLRKNIGLKAIIFGVVFVLIFLIIGFQRMKTDNPLNESLSAFTGLKMVYVYLVNGQWNLSVGIHKVSEGLQPFTWGTSSLNGVLYWFSNTMAIQVSNGWDTVMNETVKKYPGLNSTSFQWALIKDFGIVGMLFATFWFGYFLSSLYEHARNHGQASILSAFLSYPLMFSFNIFWLVEGTGSMLTILIVVGILYRQPSGNRRIAAQGE